MFLVFSAFLLAIFLRVKYIKYDDFKTTMGSNTNVYAFYYEYTIKITKIKTNLPAFAEKVGIYNLPNKCCELRE